MVKRKSVSDRNLTAPIKSHQTLTCTSPKEIKEVIKSLGLKKAPGLDQITPKMLKELPQKRIVLLTYIFNGIIRTSYWHEQFKISQIITIVSYRPTSLLSVLSKVFEKLILRRINKDLGPDEWISHHQFGFRQGHSTIQQIHRVTNIINKALEDRKYCAAVFLDVSQAFDRVWHSGLLYKLKQFLPPPYFLLLKSYLRDRKFQVRVGNEKSELQPIKAGVPQGVSLVRLYTFHTHRTYPLPPTQLSEHLPTILSYCQLTKTQEEQHPTFNITLILYKPCLRSGV
jgi:hypothetical protein